jgi:hypothetical protein
MDEENTDRTELAAQLDDHLQALVGVARDKGMDDESIIAALEEAATALREGLS